MKPLKLYSGLLYDVMHSDLGYTKPFVLASEIKPAWNFNNYIFGSAFTCKGGIVEHFDLINDDIRLEMLSKITKNSIMVYDTDAYYKVAHFGDITATIAQRAGSLGVVIDGCTRDMDAIEKLKFPIFCRNTLPIDSYGSWQITEYQIPIYIRGMRGFVKINPGDYVFGDKDGVLIIPSELLSDLLNKAQKRLKKEEELKRKIIKSSNTNLIKEYHQRGIH